MLDGSYYYNGTLKKIVAVFGTIFNNIYTGKAIDGKLMNVTRVPLAYGPKEHFLMRIKTNESDEYPTDIALRLPRMSFEMTTIGYDNNVKLNKLNTRSFATGEDNGQRNFIKQSVPYLLGMQLNIIARNQDDALQIFEQIIPTFTPEYTITVKDLEGPGTLTDVPITLNTTTFQDDYEGDFTTTKRHLVYTLDFTIRVKFIGSISNLKSVIKVVDANLYEGLNPVDATPIDRVHLELGDPVNDTKENFTVNTTFGFQ
jgi:hypothetical protein